MKAKLTLWFSGYEVRAPDAKAKNKYDKGMQKIFRKDGMI